LKVQYESSLGEIEIILVREKRCEDQLKKAQRTNKETLEEFGDVKKRLIDLEENKKRLEKENEILDKELETLKMELKVNLNRLDALQIALNSINESEEEHENDFEMNYDQEYEDVGESITNYTDLNEG
jgi:septal ring factor EnvC (AmiA/AmiB activator)